jgi:hypothetical protein
MAQVNIEQIVDQLSSEIRKALAATIREHAPDCAVNDHAVFRTFRRQVGRKCSTWETVPDQFVIKE